MKLAMKLLATAALALSGVGAQAAFVNTWGYTVSTAWVTAGVGAPTFTAGGGTQIKTPSEISWGGDNNGSTPGVGDLIVGGGDRSGLKILGSPNAGSVDTDAIVPGPVATFQHINNPISGSFATLLSATVNSTLVLTPTNPAGSALPSQSLQFSVNFAETPNVAGTCIPEATTVCDDVFVLVSGNLNQTFVYDGFTYFVSFLDLQSGPLTPLSPQACAAAGALPNCLGFWTGESQDEKIDFGLVITSERISVPEPGMLALVSLGLLGAAGASRRRRQA